ncbi:MAG: effector binding domain-containing protein [Clostridiales bacterium]|nr:effector binding domain-containing protein [Clostridiales bacterium]
MDTVRLLNNTIEFIENNLDMTLNIDEIAKTSNTSKYHFQRVFYTLTGFTVAEYIRNRRLSQAAVEIATTEEKIISIALKYGYESPESFSKAFKRLHGMTPSALKKGGFKIKNFPKISVQLSLKGETEIVFRIMEKEGFKAFGVGFSTTKTDEKIYNDIPEFINRIFENGTRDRINDLMSKPKDNLLDGFHYDFEDDGARKYMMGCEMEEAVISDELITLTIPELTWVVFEGVGEVPDNSVLHNLWKRVYTEWFPSSGFEQVEGPCIEKNYWCPEEKEKYLCELWIPVQRKY